METIVKVTVGLDVEDSTTGIVYTKLYEYISNLLMEHRAEIENIVVEYEDVTRVLVAVEPTELEYVDED